MCFIIYVLTAELCPCCALPESVKSVLLSMLDISLLKDPVFMLIGLSNVFGMAGLYVPFVYLVDSATKDVSFLPVQTVSKFKI